MDLTGQALVLAALGLPVFPCGQDKRPHSKDWPDAATRDPRVIMRWFRPGELIGIVTGPRSGLAVLDVDVPKHPEAGLWLDAHRARLPGRVFQTRSGGWHLYFRWALGVKSGAGRVGRPCVGIDTRGEGGFVIWWGGDDVGRASPQGLAEWPEWLTQVIWPPPPPKPPRKPRRRSEYVLEPVLRKLAAAPHGRRNWELHFAACCAGRDVRNGFIERAYAVHWLTVEAQRLFEPKEWIEIAPTIESGMRKGETE